MNTVWALFAIEYVIRLILAPRRLEWFFRNLPDMAVVVFPLLRPLRLLRLVMLFGVSQRSAGGALRGKITVYTTGSVALLVFVSALAVLDAERHTDGATITSFGDAVWWAFVTMATVGYGNIYPVTTVGRFIAILLMLGGVALIGVVTATLASWGISIVAEENAEEEAATRAQVAALHDQVHSLEARLQQLMPDSARADRPRDPGSTDSSGTQ